jgi:hypothetical protein
MGSQLPKRWFPKLPRRQPCHPSKRISPIMTEMTLDNLEHFVGKSLGTADWIEVDQSRIDQFAE